MKKSFLKIIYIFGVFVIALFVIGQLKNSDVQDMTAPMSSATYPVIVLQESQMDVNQLHGYSSEMDVKHMRGTIQPLDKDRSLQFRMNTYGSSVGKISYELRYMDGSGLIENNELTEYQQESENNIITGSIKLKDLIEKDTEYMLVIMADVNGQTVRYYTRVVWNGEDDTYKADQKLNFVMDFHSKTFDGENNKTELAKYIEPDSTGDNSSYSYVDIHSSFSQLTWGKLDITSVTDATAKITDLNEQTGSYILDYQIQIKDDNGKNRTYQVEETYKVRYSSVRMYLLEYCRTMNYIFCADDSDMNNNSINLYMSDSNVEMTESDGGGVLAFVNQNRLFAYNTLTNRIAYVFGFYDEKNDDLRSDYKGSIIKILNVDEAGNVRFLVSGYMNRGIHEGSVGTVIYDYDASLNVVEEKIFIPSDQSEDITGAYIDLLAYSGNGDSFYFIMGTNAYKVSLTDRTYKVVINNIMDCQYKTASDGSMIAWQDNDDMGTIHLMNFKSGKSDEIKADSDEFIRPLGFMGEDFAYGIVKQEDVRMDKMGNDIYAMSTILICDNEKNILEDYSMDGIYITDAVIEENQMNLDRVVLDKEGKDYVETDSDQILSTEIQSTKERNVVSTSKSDISELLVSITIADIVDISQAKLLTPNEILYEDNRNIEINNKRTEADSDIYFSYGNGRAEGIYTEVSDAVQKADEVSGVVLDDNNRYIWIKGNLLTKNQIMSITNEVSGVDISGQDTTMECLTLMMNAEGISQNVEAMLKKGMNAQQILETSLPDSSVLNLDGCSLSSVLYYVNQDKPVLVRMTDGNSVLIIGFNESNTVILNPKKGEASVYKMGMKDSEKLFSENGNHFLTYIMNSEN